MTYEEAWEWCFERNATLSFHELRGEKRVRVRTARGSPQVESDTVLRAIEAASHSGASPIDVLGMAELRYVAQMAMQLLGAHLARPGWVYHPGFGAAELRLFEALKDFGVSESVALAAHEELG